MTERCWEELRRAGGEIADKRRPMLEIVQDAAAYFDLPRSPEAEAVLAFLDGLRCNLEDELLALAPMAQVAE